MPKHMAEHVYMYGGKSVAAIIRCEENLMDELVDWFGRDFRILTKEDGEITIRVICNEQAMFYWALQYGDCAEVLEPKGLRDRIKDAINKMSGRYGCEIL